MIRRLLGFVFVLCLAGNSLAAAALVGDGECGAPCCRPARDAEPRASLSRPCYSECEGPGEAQPTPPKGVLGTERNYNADAPVAISLVAPFSGHSLRVLQSSGRSVIQSTHIYLRTGTLLI